MYGAALGTAIFMIVQDWLSGLNPVYWQFWIGLLLVAIVLFARGGVLGMLDRIAQHLRRKEAGP